MKATTIAARSNREERRAPALFDPADYFILIAALLSFLFSVVLWFGALGSSNKEGGLFVAVWVPSILSLGCFTKISKKGGRHG